MLQSGLATLTCLHMEEGHQALSLDHSITNWNAAETKNAGGEDCIIINDGGRWDDRSCQSNI